MISGLMIQVPGLGVTTLSLMRVEILVRAAAEAGKGLNSSLIMITLPPTVNIPQHVKYIQSNS